ncbi:dihydroxyacetone kinase subunit DhaK (plasmid) [Enterobacter bugandensis]|uniref:dihydroxyacetone kinase subunit DhaK n=1 Tax=Enterobacter bugandensis TaxID=881260 RepID=UPI00283AA167|nr:dihydroxyacetone kinase subunit DhaK [Enterobacter bugandensis]WMU75425.1 dihydroxyacetone kinase subunit DhaK [Enterobacter bugandensis]
MSQFFMNKKADLVSEALEGMLRASPFSNLAMLDAGKDIRIVVRRDWDKRRVAIISGGGAGHEPAHAGFVGKGMLTAAVCGDVFASPSVDAVLSAIINVTGDAGCLLIVKNYTGDRLNFGLAAEKARKLGYRVELVTVRDDISLPDNPQPRGVAGTALVHKVAGFAAEQGKTLEEVTAAAQDAIAKVTSIGVAFSSCNIPGENHGDRVQNGTCELGMGIHGEPGVETLQFRTGRELVSLMADKLLSTTDKHSTRALLVNNLGGFSALEMSLLTGEVLRSSLAGDVELLIGPATVVSALDMKGFSLSVISLTDNLREALLAPVETAGWPSVVIPQKPEVVVASSRIPEHHFTPSDNGTTRRALSTICTTLINAESELNALDALVGDGDTGSTFAGGARRVLSALESGQLPLDKPDDLMIAVAEHLATAMGGSSGVLMSIMLNACGQKLTEGQTLGESLGYGLNRMQYYGGANTGDRTMVDALSPAFTCIIQGGSLSEVARAAHTGAESTCSMAKANAGRSSYLNSDNLNGVKDPGAYAVELVFAALSKQFS